MALTTQQQNVLRNTVKLPAYAGKDAATIAPALSVVTKRPKTGRITLTTIAAEPPVGLGEARAVQLHDAWNAIAASTDPALGDLPGKTRLRLAMLSGSGIAANDQQITDALPVLLTTPPERGGLTQAEADTLLFDSSTPLPFVPTVADVQAAIDANTVNDRIEALVLKVNTSAGRAVQAIRTQTVTDWAGVVTLYGTL